MRIMLDGCDGVGKTTYANKLAKKFGCDVFHMTRWSNTSFKSYVSRMLNEDIIFDRCFISEYVYSEVFNRETSMTDKMLEDLIDIARNLEYDIFILTNDLDIIIKRLSFRNDESQEILENIKKLNDAYTNLAKRFNIKILKEEDLNDQII